MADEEDYQYETIFPNTINPVTNETISGKHGDDPFLTFCTNRWSPGSSGSGGGSSGDLSEIQNQINELKSEINSIKNNGKVSIDTKQYSSTSEITDPQQNVIYRVGKQEYIYDGSSFVELGNEEAHDWDEEE